jgi:acyl carrier protein
METVVTEQEVQQTLFSELRPLSAAEAEISRQATFAELDVDSLDLVELAQVIEDEFGVELKGEDMKDLRTVGQVIDLVVARAS